MAFDIIAARNSGYGDDEIVTYLQSRGYKNNDIQSIFLQTDKPENTFDIAAGKFDVKAALEAGYTEKEISDHIAQMGIAQTTTQKQPTQDYSNMSWWDVMKQSISNVPSSTQKTGEAIWQSARHPLDTAIALKNMFTTTEGRRAFGDMMVNRIMNPKETIATDPVGSLMDVSTVLSGMGGVTSKLPYVSTAGKIMSTAGKYTDPIGLVAKPVMYGMEKMGSKIIAPAIGTMVGYSSESIRTAFNGGKTFRDYMRGNQQATDILASMRGTIDDIADQKRASYQSRLQTIQDSSATVNMQPVQRSFNEQLNKFGIKLDAEGGLDFSRARIDKKFQPDVKEIYDRVKTWGTQEGDLTAYGMDTLKQQLDEFFSTVPNGQQKIDAFLKPVKDSIVRSVSAIEPSYPIMLKEYGKMSELQKTIQNAFSTKDPTRADAAITKITQALKDNREFRTQLIDTMDSQTGSAIKESIAGYNLRGFMPQTWLGRSFDLGTIMGVGAGVISPKLIAVLGLSSPRVVGEFANVLGRAYTVGSKARSLLPKGIISKPTFQAGRASLIERERED